MIGLYRRKVPRLHQLWYQWLPWISIRSDMKSEVMTDHDSSNPNNVEHSDAIVIGAGIVGVCTALELSKNGYNVTVIERFPLAAQFCSMANAGLSRLHFPLQFQSLHSQLGSSRVLEALKSLSPTFQPNQTTHIALDPYFFTDRTCYRWLYSFIKSQFYVNKQTQDTRTLFDTYCFNTFVSNTNELNAKTGYNCQSNGGFAMIFPSNTDNTGAYDTYSDLTQMKCTAFNNSSVTAEQKHLHNITVEAFPSSFVSDCHRLCNAIVTQPNDIQFKFNTKATEILVNEQNNVCGVTIVDDNGHTTLKANKVVICAGVLTNHIIQSKVYQINNRQGKHRMKLPCVPIIPLQGFSITIPYAPRKRYQYPYGIMEYYPSYLCASRVNDHSLRFSAYGYFRNTRYSTKVWKDMRVECREGVQSNVDMMGKQERLLLDNMETCIKDDLLSLYDVDEEYFDEHKIRWTGFRPYTPDGLPIVDQVRSVSGLYLNAGHGTYGVCTSHATAKLVVQLMNKQMNDSERKMLDILSLERFDN
eukprot:68091_1